ncbi:MAG: DNA replication/repair protein RecF [Fimbriimonadaceae bacterium]
MTETIRDSRTIAENWVSQLSLESFRNFEHQQVSLDPGLNVVVGRNAQGKTNLLEAVYFLSHAKLLRGSGDADGIEHGASTATVSSVLEPHSEQMKIVLVRGSRKQVFFNENKVTKKSEWRERIPCVIVWAEDMLLVKGDAGNRRSFLDDLLGQISASYRLEAESYEKALRQRNALLKKLDPKGSWDPNEFSVWESMLASSGTKIRFMRESIVEQLESAAIEGTRVLSSGERLGLRPVQKDQSQTEDELALLLENTREQDFYRGFTGVGPHRDDLEIMLEDQPARHYGSQGQQRTIVLSMKFASMKVLADTLRRKVLLLLDDMLSDLDSKRREQLVTLLDEHSGQAILTCTEVPELPLSGKILKVEHGRVSEQ